MSGGRARSVALQHNGLLHVDLVREIPEAMKPRSIPIASSSKLLEVKPTKVAA
jgi:molecular chaperone IbpA